MRDPEYSLCVLPMPRQTLFERGIVVIVADLKRAQAPCTRLAVLGCQRLWVASWAVTAARPTSLHKFIGSVQVQQSECPAVAREAVQIRQLDSVPRQVLEYRPAIDPIHFVPEGEAERIVSDPAELVHLLKHAKEFGIADEYPVDGIPWPDHWQV